MPRPEKVQAVAEIKERIESAQAVFLAEYAGLSVKDQQNLRRALRAGGAEFKVVKMTLARRAAGELELEGIDDLLLGPTGLTFADGDPVTAAKALKDFAKDHEVFAIKGGLLGNDLLTPERVSELADIEPREVLLARIAGAAQAPMAKMAGLLAAMPRNLASMMQQLVDRMGPVDEPAPVDDAPAEMAAADQEESTVDATAAEETTAADVATEDEDTTVDADASKEADASEEAADEDAPAAEAESADAPDDGEVADDDSKPEPEAAAEKPDADASAEADEADDAHAAQEDDTADAEASDEEE